MTTESPLSNFNKFQNERRDEIISVINIISNRMSIPLYILFWVADWLYSPNNIWLFLFLRLTVTPVCILSIILMKRSNSVKHVQRLALLITFWNALIINIMIMMTDGPSSPYYAGLNLVGLASLSFIPWEWTFGVTALLLTYGPYTFY